MSDRGSPYRQMEIVARWVCVACHRSLSSVAGVCPNCNVERLDLLRPDVRDEVRRYAEGQLSRRQMREEMALGISSALTGIVAALVCTQWWQVGVIARAVGVVVGLGTYYAARRLYVQFEPRSAIATFALRKLRLGAGGDMTQNEAPISPLLLTTAASENDPEVVEVEQLLRGLGAKLDG